MNGPGDAVLPALVQLHLAVARARRRLADRAEGWSLMTTSPLLSERVLDDASDPDADRLLDWQVYQAVLVAARTTEKDLAYYRRLWRVARIERRADSGSEPPCPPARPVGGVPKMRTERDFMDELRRLSKVRGRSLRDLEAEMRRVDKRNAVGKSTLGTWLRSDCVPSNLIGLEALLKVLLPVSDGGAGQSLIDAYLQVADDLRAERHRPIPRAVEPEPAPEPAEVPASAHPVRTILLAHAVVVSALCLLAGVVIGVVVA